MIGDIIVCCLLGFAVFTGLYTIERHHPYFADFRLSDLFFVRMDGLLYVSNLLSTSLCLVDIALRILWMAEVGWGEESTWQFLWLGWHAGHACVSTLIHFTTNRLLNNDDVCALCRRRL